MIEDDREKVFASIRKGLRGSDKFAGNRSTKSPLLERVGDDFATRFAKFKSELAALGGETAVFEDETDISDFVSARTKQDHSLFIYEDIRNNRRAFTAAITESRSARFELEFATGYDKREVAGFDSVITGCLACVAETGTIVLNTDMRLPAALARQLFVIASEKHLMPSLDELFTDKFSSFTGSNLFLITGPSRTADIEKQLVTGVHGPKEVYVIFFQ